MAGGQTNVNDCDHFGGDAYREVTVSGQRKVCSDVLKVRHLHPSNGSTDDTYSLLPSPWLVGHVTSPEFDLSCGYLVEWPPPRAPVC